MKIAYNASLPPPRQLAVHAPASTAVVPRPGHEAARPNKANHVPNEHGMEGELLKGRAKAAGPSIHGGGQGYTHRGDYRVDGLLSARRAISVYTYHAGLTAPSPAPALDVYA